MLANNALDLIGNTPLLKLSNLHPGPGEIFVKAEHLQPGGSIKDRAALQIIKDAYSTGILETGNPVVEMTSGNMGSGLAVVCNLYGNPFTAVMSKGNSPERVKMLKGLGAKVERVPQVNGTEGKVTGKDIDAAVSRAIELTKESNGFYVDQFNNNSCVKAHYNNTGPEIWKELVNISAFVASVGTGASFIGTSKYLKQQNSNVKCAVVEPSKSRYLAKGVVEDPKHILQGTGYGRALPFWEPGLVDEFLCVTNDEAKEYQRLLGSRESLFVGFSSAANVCAAIKYLESGKLGKSAKVVTFLCDTGLKYGDFFKDD